MISFDNQGLFFYIDHFLSKRFFSMLKRIWYPLSFLGPFFMLFFFYLSFFLKGFSFYLVPFFSFILVPFLDALIGQDKGNFNDSQYGLMQDSKYYNGVLFFLFLSVMGAIYGSIWFYCHEDLSFVETIGLFLSLGLVSGGLGINLAHELGHKKGFFPQLVAQTLLTHVFYGHFLIEHNKGHHRNVSTPFDPASSRFNEGLYHFFPRTLIGTFKSAYHLGFYNSTDKVFWKNHTLLLTFISVIIASFFAVIGGTKGLCLFLIQAFLAIFLLEIINYVEHYGLERKKNPSGRYEKVRPYHSWNSDYIFSNGLLLNLQRHSDHHSFADRPYQNLRTHKNVPQLPWGYPTMIILALFPSLWRKVVHPLMKQ
jgi:alkane 1-monooxygenase